MSLEYALLGFLARSGQSGYDLKRQRIDHDSRHVWSADQAQVYRTLDKLADRGLVATHTQRQDRRPDRKVVDITPAGRTELASWLTSAHPLSASRDPFLLQIMLSDDLTADELRSVLAARRREHLLRLEDIRGRISALSLAPVSDRVSRARLMALKGAEAVDVAAVHWLEGSLDTLEIEGSPLP